MQKSKSLFLFLLFNVATLARVGWGPVGSLLPAPATTQSPSLSFPGKKNVCVTQQSWSSVVLPITDLLCLCSSLSCGGGLIRCEGCVESLSFSSWWLQQFCFVLFLPAWDSWGNCNFLGTLVLSVWWPKGGIQVSLQFLSELWQCPCKKFIVRSVLLVHVDPIYLSRPWVLPFPGLSWASASAPSVMCAMFTQCSVYFSFKYWPRVLHFFLTWFISYLKAWNMSWKSILHRVMLRTF